MDLEEGGVQYVQVGDVSSLEALSSKAFVISSGGEGGYDGFFVREEDMTLRAYKNSCPHTGAPLNWMPDQFLTTAGRYIQCAIHGAMFATDTGECFYGPCVGRSLRPLRVVEKEGVAYISIAEIEKNPS